MLSGYAASLANQSGSAENSSAPRDSNIASAGVGSNGSRSNGIPASTGVRFALR